jgi:hypothetical protein
LRPIRKLMSVSATRGSLIVLSCIVLGTALGTDALAAERAVHGVSHGHARLGFSGPILTTPSTPPTFNPYSPCAVPQTHKTPARHRVQDRSLEIIEVRIIAMNVSPSRAAS